MIKVNDRFSMERDANGWTLYEFLAPGIHPITKEPGEKPRVRERYYPSLGHILVAMADLDLQSAESIEDIRVRLDAFKRDIYDEILGIAPTGRTQ